MFTRSGIREYWLIFALKCLSSSTAYTACTDFNMLATLQHNNHNLHYSNESHITAPDVWAVRSTLFFTLRCDIFNIPQISCIVEDPNSVFYTSILLPQPTVPFISISNVTWHKHKYTWHTHRYTWHIVVNTWQHTYSIYPSPFAHKSPYSR